VYLASELIGGPPKPGQQRVEPLRADEQPPAGAVGADPLVTGRDPQVSLVEDWIARVEG
jgi:hypothetical protein